jgi:hypothetical protein
MRVLARPPLPLLLACAAVISGCRKPAASSAPTASPTLLPGTFINSPGSWWTHHASGSFRLDINATKSGFEYRYGLFAEPLPPTGRLGSGGAGPIEFPPWSPDWFFYVEDTGNPKYLWCYGNSRRLWYMTIKGKDYDPPIHTVIDEHGKRSELGRSVPADVIQRLPADLQKLFAAEKAPLERPTF